MKILNKTAKKLDRYDSPFNAEMEWEKLNIRSKKRILHEKLKSENTMLKILLLLSLIASGSYLLNDKLSSQKTALNEKALPLENTSSVSDLLLDFENNTKVTKQDESVKVEIFKIISQVTNSDDQVKYKNDKTLEKKDSKIQLVNKADHIKAVTDTPINEVLEARDFLLSDQLTPDDNLLNTSKRKKIKGMQQLSKNQRLFATPNRLTLDLNQMSLSVITTNEKKKKAERIRMNSIKLDPVGGWLNYPEVTANFSFERRLVDKLSIQLSCEYVIPGITTGTTVGGDTRTFEIQGKGLVFRPEMRYYPFGNSMNGAYVGGSIIYRHVNFNLNESTTSQINLTGVTQYRNLNAGLQLGYQKIFKNGITLNAFAGLDIGNRKSTTVYQDEDLNQFDLMNPDIEKVGDIYFNDLYFNVPDFYPSYNFLTPKLGIAIGYSF